MSKERVYVVIDSNEAAQNLDLTEILVMHEDIEDYRIEPLDEGDIHIDDCIFERKTPADFASSLQEGRLRDQVERMAGRQENTFLLVEGDMRDFENLTGTDIPAKSLRGMVASIIVRNRIPVVFCSEPETLADEAVRLARKATEEPTSVQAKTTDTVREPTFMENVFLGIDGIGIETAEKLAQKFSSLSLLTSATREELEEVEGIGSKRVEDVLRCVGSEETSDDSDDGGVNVVNI